MRHFLTILIFDESSGIGLAPRAKIAKKESESTIRDFFLLLHRRSLIEEAKDLLAEEKWDLCILHCGEFAVEFAAFFFLEKMSL